MNVKYAKYDAAGRILFMGSVPEGMIELQGDNLWMGDEANPQTEYIVGGEKVARPESPAMFSKMTVTADSTDELVISGVPVGAKIDVTGPTAMSGVTDAAVDVTMTFALAGTYTVLLTLFPYQDKRVTIHAI